MRDLTSDSVELLKKTLHTYVRIGLLLLLIPSVLTLPAGELYLHLVRRGLLDPDTMWTLSGAFDWAVRHATVHQAALAVEQVVTVLALAALSAAVASGSGRATNSTLRALLSARKLAKTAATLVTLNLTISALTLLVQNIPAAVPDAAAVVVDPALSLLVTLLTGLTILHVIGVAVEPAESRTVTETLTVLRFDGVTFISAATLLTLVGNLALPLLAKGVSFLVVAGLGGTFALASSIVDAISPLLTILWLYPLAAHIRTAWSA